MLTALSAQSHLLCPDAPWSSQMWQPVRLPVGAHYPPIPHRPVTLQGQSVKEASPCCQGGWTDMVWLWSGLTHDLWHGSHVS